MFGITAHRGWNVIDTASNYRGGRGERAIGYALTALHEQLGLTREMLFISTKAGFLQDEVKNQVKHCCHSCLTSNALNPFLRLHGCLLAAACTASVHGKGATHNVMSTQLACTSSISQLAVPVMTDIPADSMPTSEPKCIHAWAILLACQSLAVQLKGIAPEM